MAGAAPVAPEPVMEAKAPTPRPKRSSRKVDEAAGRSKTKHQGKAVDPFRVSSALHPPGVAPSAQMAMDDASGNGAINAWAFQNINVILADGQTFLGYPLLSELAQRPEYRRISETIARHCVRKWIEFDVRTDGAGAGGDKKDQDDKNEDAAAEVDEDQDASAEAAAESDDEDASPFSGGQDLAFGNGAPGEAPKEGSKTSDPKDTGPEADAPDGSAGEKPEKSLAPDQEKLDKVAKIEERLEEIGAKAAFLKFTEQDGFFGRSHLYIDTGATDDPAELKTPLGDGANEVSEVKLKNKAGLIEKLRPVEAVWVYPTNYNSNDPLKPDWYKPKSWFVMGKELDASRLLTGVGREVPDILKPAYSFGGLAMSQMMRPYVENWLNTRQSVANIVRSFSVFVLKTQLTDALAESGDPDQLFRRVELFNNFRENEGAFVIDKTDEEFANVSASLASLDKLQAQAQEQMASIAGIPIVLLLMITPSGLNASSDGEIQAFWDWIHSYQESFLRTPLTTIINMIQMCEFGEIDPDITWTFSRLEGLNDLEWAQKELAQAQTDATYCDAGIIEPVEVRKALAADTQSRYHGLDIDDVPEPPEPELPPGMGMMPGAAKPGAPGEPAKPGVPAAAKPPGAVTKPPAAKKEPAG